MALSRTHRVSMGWVHERCINNDFEFVHEAVTKMPSDIFTKMFFDEAKWTAARHFINVALPEEIDTVIALNIKVASEYFELAAEAGVEAGACRPEPGGMPAHFSGGG